MSDLPQTPSIAEEWQDATLDLGEGSDSDDEAGNNGDSEGASNNSNVEQTEESNSDEASAVSKESSGIGSFVDAAEDKDSDISMGTAEKSKETNDLISFDDKMNESSISNAGSQGSSGIGSFVDASKLDESASSMSFVHAPNPKEDKPGNNSESTFGSGMGSFVDVSKAEESIPEETGENKETSTDNSQNDEMDSSNGLESFINASKDLMDSSTAMGIDDVSDLLAELEKKNAGITDVDDTSAGKTSVDGATGDDEQAGTADISKEDEGTGGEVIESKQDEDEIPPESETPTGVSGDNSVEVKGATEEESVIKEEEAITEERIPMSEEKEASSEEDNKEEEVQEDVVVEESNEETEEVQEEAIKDEPIQISEEKETSVEEDDKDEGVLAEAIAEEPTPEEKEASVEEGQGDTEKEVKVEDAVEESNEENEDVQPPTDNQDTANREEEVGNADVYYVDGCVSNVSRMSNISQYTHITTESASTYKHKNTAKNEMPSDDQSFISENSMMKGHQVTSVQASSIPLMTTLETEEYRKERDRLELRKIALVEMSRSYRSSQEDLDEEPKESDITPTASSSTPTAPQIIPPPPPPPPAPIPANYVTPTVSAGKGEVEMKTLDAPKNGETAVTKALDPQYTPIKQTSEYKMTMNSTFDIERLIKVGVFLLIGGGLGSFYAEHTCHFVSIKHYIGYYAEPFHLHAGMYEYTSMDSAFTGHSFCLPYDGYYSASEPVFPRTAGSVAFYFGLLTSLILWFYLIFLRTHVLVWKLGICFAALASLCQTCTYYFFFDDVCTGERCRIGPGAFMSAVAAFAYGFTAREMYRNSPLHSMNKAPKYEVENSSYIAPNFV